MNANDYSSLQNKKTSADSGLYGTGSAYRTVPAAEGGAYGGNSYSQRNTAYDPYRAPMQSRASYESPAYGPVSRQNGTSPVTGGQQQRPQPQRHPSYDARPQTSSGHNHRINHNPTAKNSGNGKPAANGNGMKANGNGAGSGGSGSGGKSNGYSNGNGNGVGNGGKGYSNGNGGNGNGKKPIKKTFRQQFVAWLKRALRSVYLFGKSLSKWFARTFQKIGRLDKPIRIFLASAAGFVVIALVVIVAVSGTRQQREEAIQAELSLATPVPTVAPTATPEPTPSPTPEIRIEKGAEGEDVMSLQKRLMELGYLAIDEPTSYFGNATKAALKLFQRQHDLQQDGICGTETIAMIYAEDAKPYVMMEGEEGDDIQAFQEQLVELGYLESNQVTSYYGTDTVDAVKDFQRRNYLTKDGKAGEKTIEAINSPDARVSYTKEQEIIAEKKKQAALARASSAEGRIDKLINAAKKQLGDPYILGKSGPDSFDCSGLVVYCLRQANVYTRRLNAAGLSRTTSWTKISSLNDVKRGDLLFFKSDDSSGIGHVGIYIGNGEMIDASSANGKVVRRGAKTSYWRRNFVVARRPIE